MRNQILNKDSSLECPQCGTVQAALNEKCEKCGALLVFGRCINLTRWIVGGTGFLAASYVASLILTGVMTR
jgi:hypothetical protein